MGRDCGAVRRRILGSAAHVNVAIVSGAPLKHESEIGGAYYSRTLAAKLQRAGLNVEIWSKIGVGDAAESEARVIPTWRAGWFAWIDIVRAARKRKPDILHIQHSMFVLGPGAAGEFSMLLLLALLQFTGTRVVVTVHDIPELDQITSEYVRMHGYKFPAPIVIAGLRLLFLTIALCSEAIVVHQQDFATTLVRDFHVAPGKVAVIPHVAAQIRTASRREARSALGLQEDERVILFFGFATRYKGIELLLEAMREAGPGSRLKLLLGAGEHPKVAHRADYVEYYSGIKRLAASVPGVDFLGFLPDAQLDEYVEAADVAVFPYIEVQSMSGPLTICAAHRKPVLVSARIAEKVPDLQACAFEPAGAALARAMARFFDDPLYRSDVEAQSLAFADRVNGDEAVAKTIALYRRIAKAPA